MSAKLRFQSPADLSGSIVIQTQFFMWLPRGFPQNAAAAEKKPLLPSAKALMPSVCKNVLLFGSIFQLIEAIPLRGLEQGVPWKSNLTQKRTSTFRIVRGRESSALARSSPATRSKSGLDRLLPRERSSRANRDWN